MIDAVARRRSPGDGGCPRPSGGFTYLAVMFLVFLLGRVATLAVDVYRVSLRRDQEADLLFVGHAYKMAIESYRARSPNGRQPYPTKLEELLRDRRTFQVVHHLRAIYTDPVANGQALGLLRNAAGGIVGVYSQSAQVPVRIANLPDGLPSNAKSYRDWRFLAEGADLGGQAPKPTTAATTGAPTADAVAAPILTPGDDGGGGASVPIFAPFNVRDLAPGRRNPEVCAQLLAMEEVTCASFANQGNSTLAAQCSQSAALRNGQCLAGSPLSPLVIR